MRRVAFSDTALRHLGSARSWLTQPGSGPSGRARWRALRDVKLMLRDHPYAGRQLTAVDNHFQVIVSDYRVIYQVLPNTGDSMTAGTVRIVANLGPGQD